MCGELGPSCVLSGVASGLASGRCKSGWDLKATPKCKRSENRSSHPLILSPPPRIRRRFAMAEKSRYGGQPSLCASRKAGLPAVARSGGPENIRARLRARRYGGQPSLSASRKAGLPAVARSEAESEGWYARRGSNPQPSAPEADALSN